MGWLSKSNEDTSSERALVRALTAVFFAGLVVVLSLPFFSHASWLIFVQDDFLYYLKVAINLSQGRGSTFNGIVETNGYQPLWLYILVLLCRLTTHPQVIFGFVALCILCSATITFYFAGKILVRSGARPLLVFSLSGWITLYSVTLFFYGMEVILTIPIMLCVLWLMFDMRWIRQSWFTAFVFGLLLSSMVLSRIDTLIFGAIVLTGLLVNQDLRRLFRRDLIVGLVAGLMPLAVYFEVNHRQFRTWLPVSGMAKELKKGHWPSLEPWRVFFHPLAAAFTLLIASAMLLMLLTQRRLKAVDRVLLWSTLLFPFIYYLALSCVSDWTLWGWYMYPIRTAITASFFILLSWRPMLKVLEKNGVTVPLVGSVFLCLVMVRWTRQQEDIYDATLEIQQFALGHPGTYAMGDRAGRVGYLIPNPVVQTEGLMMDRDYLKYIKNETPIRVALSHYGVRYYVATAYEPFTGCFKAVEPAKAGPTSAKMSDVFCEQPTARFVHQGIQTMIYDLGKR